MTQFSNKIIVALDTDSLCKAKKLVRELWLRVKFFKIGLELINTGQAPALIRFIKKSGGRVFYDVKLNDIPNTVGKSAKVISKLGVWGFTVHGSSGMEAVRAAVKNKGKVKVIGVTTLTSLKTPQKSIIKLAKSLIEGGVDGIVCSAKEAAILKKFSAKGGSASGGENLIIITPGIRPVWADKNDQRRSATPKEAIMAGADYLVIGRPITGPSNGLSPKKALDAILKEVNG